MARKREQRIVILGGGFAGLAAALALPSDCAVTLVDTRSAFEFLPNIHELVSGVKRPASLRLPLEPVLERAGHGFVCDTVTDVDADDRRVRLEHGGSLPYDALIVALGGVNATHGVPGSVEHALPFKSVDECDTIRRRLDRLAQMRRPQHVVIVGGGLEGVEALGEILRVHTRPNRLRLHLVEARDRLLPEAPASLDGIVRELAADADVEFILDTPVERVESNAVFLAGGRRIPSRATIWTGGPTAPPVLARAGLAERKGAWAAVAQTLVSRADPRILVAGDCAALPKPLPKQAYHALDMGRAAAANALRILDRRPLVPFEASDKPSLVSFGERSCFLIAGKNVAATPLLSAGKEAVFQLVMAQLDRRGPLSATASGAARVGQAALGLIRTPPLSPSAFLRGTRLPRTRPRPRPGASRTPPPTGGA